MLWDYSQPDFYHFDSDSTWLATNVVKRIKKNSKILDLFSGCGVVGLEVFQKSQFTHHISFIELQKEFKSHFLKNIELLSIANDYFQFINKTFEEVAFTEKQFDFIIANPPYFLAGEGRLSPNEQKNICRHQIGFNWKSVFHFVKSCLTDNGEFIFLTRQPVESFKDIEGFEFFELGKRANTFLLVSKRLDID